jgi:hypothetical protein
LTTIAAGVIGVLIVSVVGFGVAHLSRRKQAADPASD